MKLLLVDDNENMRRIMQDLFAPYFSEIVECSDGEEAVALYPSISPDWTVMDIQMKRMDGIEAAKIILSNDINARIILISQHTEEEIVAEALRSGAVAFVRKDDLPTIIGIVESNMCLPEG
ncbi:MAG: response regulator transcription factor [Bacteroidota bacterium]